MNIAMDSKLERIFDDVFGGQADNELRKERYLQKRVRDRGPYILTYEVNGEPFYTSGASPKDAIKRTNAKHPNGWEYSNIETEREFLTRNRT